MMTLGSAKFSVIVIRGEKVVDYTLPDGRGGLIPLEPAVEMLIAEVERLQRKLDAEKDRGRDS